jgi:integrase
LPAPLVDRQVERSLAVRRACRPTRSRPIAGNLPPLFVDDSDGPCHHNLEEYLTAYLDGAGLRGDPKGPLFRTIGRGTARFPRIVLPQANAYAMIGRRAAPAGIASKLGNHSFRATGITAYLKNGGTLEKAAAMANRASTRTTQLYDRWRDEVSLDEVERIVI